MCLRGWVCLWGLCLDREKSFPREPLLLRPGAQNMEQTWLHSEATSSPRGLRPSGPASPSEISPSWATSRHPRLTEELQMGQQIHEQACEIAVLRRGSANYGLQGNPAHTGVGWPTSEERFVCFLVVGNKPREEYFIL